MTRKEKRRVSRFPCFFLRATSLLSWRNLVSSLYLFHSQQQLFFLPSQLLSVWLLMILLPNSVESIGVTGGAAVNPKITLPSRKLLHLEMLQKKKLEDGVKASASATFLEDTFIVNLISQERFSHCSLMMLQDRFDNGASVDRILASVSSPPPPSSSSALALSPPSPLGMKSAYSIKYNFPSPLELEAIEEQLKELKLKWWNISVAEALNSRDSLPLVFPITVSNYRRYSDPCLIVILTLNDLRPEFIRQIYNMITPVYIPITRKDEDLYIFKTEAQHHAHLLQMRELPSRIKFKIAVGSEMSAEKKQMLVKVRTVCFFCEAGGNPRLEELPVSDNNLPVGNVDYFPDFVYNLNGKLIHVSFPYIRAKIEADPPWTEVWNARRGNWKMLFELLLTVKFNFTYHMFAATGKDGNYGGGGTGTQLENGTWIGVTGDLVSGKADLGIVIANTPKRIYAIDFTNSFYDIGCLTFVTAQPSRIFSPAALLWPFDGGMWAAIGFCTFLSVIFFFSTFKCMEKLRIGTGEKWSLSVQIQFLISTFLDQDSPVQPESHALRSFVALWFFFTMILTNIYRSKMVALLAFPVLGTLPRTFDELAFSEYEVGFMRHGDSAYNTLAASTDPVYVKLVAEMEIFRGFGLECLEKTVKYKYGCIAYDFALVHLRERNLSDSDTRKLVFAPARTYNIWLGLGTEGKSIYRLNFGNFLARTRSFHLADIWDKMDMYYNVRLLKLQWWESTGQMDKAKNVEEESDDLTLKHIAGAFYVLIACLIISSAAFIQELVAFHRKNFYNGFMFRYWAAKHAVKKFRHGRNKDPVSFPMDNHAW